MGATVERIDHSVSIAKANSWMLLIAVPSVAALVALYLAVWGLGDFAAGLGQFLQWRVVIPTLVVGVPLHEFIHGVAWAMASGRPLSDVSFGFQWKTLTPYAHLQEPVPATAYRWGAVMPAVMLGLLPYLVGLALGSGWLACLGLFFIFTAGGDLLVLWLLRGVGGGALTEDHPSRAGCYVYRRSDRATDGQGRSRAT
jgi:hypothetical protein